MRLGMTKQEIIDTLSSHGINDGEVSSAEKLKEAIADVILKNNTKIRNEVTKAVDEDIRKMMLKRGIR